MGFEFELELVHIHLLVLFLTALVIVQADYDAFAYLRGKKSLLDLKRVRYLHYLVTAGLVGMILTGVGLFYDAWGELIDKPSFYIKMVFVLALIVNAVVITTLIPIATKTPFAELTDKVRFKLMISGAISSLSWVGAATVGIFFL